MIIDKKAKWPNGFWVGIICLFLSAGILPKASAETMLHKAVESNQLEKVTELIKAGANVNARDEEDWTPLHGAAGGHNIEIVRLLVKAGANVHVKNKYGKTPLDEALDPLNVSSKKDREEVTQYLVQEMKKKRQ